MTEFPLSVYWWVLYSIYPMLDDMSEVQCMLWCVFLSPPLPFKVPLIEMLGVDRLNFWLPDTLCTCRLEDNSGLLVKQLFVLVKTWWWEPVERHSHWHTIGCNLLYFWYQGIACLVNELCHIMLMYVCSQQKQLLLMVLCSCKSL